jgi:hypothetical protein
MTSLTTVRKPEVKSKDSIASMFSPSPFAVEEIGPHEGQDIRRQTTRHQFLSCDATTRTDQITVTRRECAQQCLPHQEVLRSTRREFFR